MSISVPTLDSTKRVRPRYLPTWLAETAIAAIATAAADAGTAAGAAATAATAAATSAGDAVRAVAAKYTKPDGGVPPTDIDLAALAANATLLGAVTNAVLASGAIPTRPRTQALGILRAGLAARAVRPCRLVFAGSSTTAGNNATLPAYRFVNQLVAVTQAAYPSGTGSEAPVTTSTSASWGTINPAPGVHGYNAGEGGTASADYLTSSERSSIANLAPTMVMHMVGANDYRLGVAPATFKARLTASIADLKSKMSGPCVHVLVNTYPRFDAATVSARVAPWEDYGAAMAQIAAADPANVAYIDIAPVYATVGVPGTDPLNLIDTDDVHQTDAGHALMADLLRETLGITQAAGTATATPVDTTPPSVPSNLAAASGNAQANLTWSASTDNVAVTGYRIRRDGASVATTSGTSHTATGLTNGTSYSFTVAAYDAAGNESAASPAVVAIPAASSDTTAPTTPGTPTATAGAGSATVTTSGSTDNVGVTGYRWYRGGNQVGSTTGTTFAETGLPAGSAVTYTVSAVDAAGNLSAQSAASNAVTPVGLGVYSSDRFSTDSTNFNTRTTDGLAGGTAQTYLTSTSDAALASSGGVMQRGATVAAQFAALSMPTANQSLAARVMALPTGAAIHLVIMRQALAASAAYRVIINTTGDVALQKLNSAGTTVTDLNVTGTIAAGDTLEVRREGTSVSLIKNGAVLGTATDSSVTGPGYAGVTVGTSSASFQLDDLTWRSA